MPFPSDNEPWPPVEAQPAYFKMAEWAAWYSGDPERLVDFYSSTAATGRPNPWWRFWGRAREARVDGSQRAQLHVPLTSDLAATSAALLFGEVPRVRIKEAHEDEDPGETQVSGSEGGAPAVGAPPRPLAEPKGMPGQMRDLAVRHDGLKPGPSETMMFQRQRPQKKPETPAQKTEARLLEILEMGDAFARLMEAAESAAAIGGVYIYPAWDKDIKDFPILAVAQADQAWPQFRHGFLVSVLFHRVVKKAGNEIFRHLELHETEGTGETRKAIVRHKVFKGTDVNIGVETSLLSIEETKGLEPKVRLPFNELDVEYIPNIRPNRLWRYSGLGVADIQGSETLLDALDEVFASWMRDVRLAKARIIVPAEYLRWPKDADGNSLPYFDLDQEIYSPMDMMPDPEASAKAMMAHQFEIRYAEHRDTALALIERIVSNAGYVPSTLGISGANSNPLRGTTGTALRISEHKTILTQRRKAANWRVALGNVFHRMLLIDKEIFKSQVEPIKPTVEMADSVIDQPLELAQTALAMKSAESASIETRVRVLHPSWTEAEIASEVLRIQDEVAMATPPTVVSPPKFGDGKTDGASTQNLPRNDPTGPDPSDARARK